MSRQEFQKAVERLAHDGEAVHPLAAVVLYTLAGSIAIGDENVRALADAAAKHSQQSLAALTSHERN